MTILVTGGAGYIGSHVVYGLVEQQHSVVVIDNLWTGFRDAVAPVAHLIVSDVGDEKLVSATIAKHQVTAVMHFAASTVVPESVANPIAYYWNNTANSLSLTAGVLFAWRHENSRSSYTSDFADKELPVRTGPSAPDAPL